MRRVFLRPESPTFPAGISLAAQTLLFIPWKISGVSSILLTAVVIIAHPMIGVLVWTRGIRSSCALLIPAIAGGRVEPYVLASLD